MAIYRYRTEPLTDFSKRENSIAFENGLKVVKSYLGKDYPIVINGKRMETSDIQTSYNPADQEEIIGHVYQSSLQEVNLAFASALQTFEAWKNTKASMRSDILLNAAAILRRRKFEFSALLTKEAGKNWEEADGETAEAIDFLEYYGRQILELQNIDGKVLSRENVERNEYRYIPLGVGVVITPWNFPLAILAGMTTAAIVAGNTVLLKPASATPIVAYKFLEILEQAGLPDGVVNLIPGRGSKIGDYLVNHPKTRFISFTGSKEVGISIYEQAAKVGHGQIWLKRVIAEMGGKDAMVVDDGADLDLAAKSIVQSAFGYSGQKCSACSRVIIHEKVYDNLVKKIVENTKRLTVGSPEKQNTDVGPVIDKKAYEKIISYFDIGNSEGSLLVGGTSSNKTGWFIEPTIFADVAPTSRLMQEEIFGPILAICKVSSFDEALEVANNTEYGLTGSVFSRDRNHIEEAKLKFHVGNLYINRGCTGAIVGYQPFGGFNMSGTDSKAGGPDYLILHMQGKTICEEF